MALRAGYKGIKNDMFSAIKNLISLGVKSLGTMFNVSNSGVLTVKKATGSAAGIVQPDGTTIRVNNGVISAEGGGAFEAIATGTITLPNTAATLTDSIELPFIPDIISVDAPLTDRASYCYYSRLVCPGITFWYIPSEVKQEMNNATPGGSHANGLAIAEVSGNTFKMKSGSGSNTIGVTVTYTAYKFKTEVN